MSVTPGFEHAVHAAEEWLDEFINRLGWHDRQRAYSALIATLPALRDCLPQEQAIDLGAQLPSLIRGFYFEGWHSHARATARTRAAFFERIFDAVHRDPAIDAEAVARALLGLLTARLPPAEIESVKAATPHDLHNLWPS